MKYSIAEPAPLTAVRAQGQAAGFAALGVLLPVGEFFALLAMGSPCEMWARGSLRRGDELG